MYISSELRHKIETCKILLVGAGGIGCEVLKNLTLTGFKLIDTIDLDTIDVSNLNRQFLFNKTNVGQSKSKVAVEIAKTNYVPTTSGLQLTSIHSSIMLTEFDVDFFRNYTLVINALDNRAARSHVNRMCLAAHIPLLESGTAGYTGQSKLIKNGLTACYDCDGIQKEGRTYATCTIRNTPSQPIHCIVWAKHLFHQLFGEEDPDNDVSPQQEANTAPEKSTVTNGNGVLGNSSASSSEIATNQQVTENTSETEKENHTQSKEVKLKSTREWAMENSYDPVLLIQKLYNDDIRYLLSMDNLWKNRAKPTPLNYLDLITATNDTRQPGTSSSSAPSTLDNQRLWSLKECVQVFSETVEALHKRMKSEGFLRWDKDDEFALNFLVAASNLRSACFKIDRKSVFDAKQLAGNIVPAISSTNSIIGGLLVLQTLRFLKSLPAEEEYKKLDDSQRNELIKDAGRLSYLNYTSLTRPDLIASYECPPPVASCLSCAKGNTPEIEIHLSMEATSFSDLVDKIVLGTFHFVCPDICLNDDSGTILWTKDEGNDATNDKSMKRKLIEINQIKPPKTRLLVSDLLQDKEIIMVLIDENVDEDEHKNFFYARLNGQELTV